MSVSEEQVAPLRDASTVVLVRDGDGEIDVFLQRRVKQMAFAGGMTVFPGGGVDQRDSDAGLVWAGPDADWWAQRLGTDTELARALVSAAVRETFEECGVLLAGSAEQVYPTPADFAEQRRQLVDKELSLSRFLADNDLVMRTDLLHPLAHWITPKNEARRYDTRFFVAELPAGQEADGDTSEASEARWQSATAALDDWVAGRSFLLPPTWTQLRELARHASVADLVAVPREIVPIEPELREGAGPHPLTRVGFDGAEEYLAVLADGRLDRIGG